MDYEEKYGYSAVSEEKRENDDYFYAAMGGEAIKEMLSRINIMELKKSSKMWLRRQSLNKKEQML